MAEVGLTLAPALALSQEANALVQSHLSALTGVVLSLPPVAADALGQGHPGRLLSYPRAGRDLVPPPHTQVPAPSHHHIGESWVQVVAGDWWGFLSSKLAFIISF